MCTCMFSKTMKALTLRLTYKMNTYLYYFVYLKLPKEISFPHLPTWNNLQKENRTLRNQVHILNSEQRRLSVNMI